MDRDAFLQYLQALIAYDGEYVWVIEIFIVLLVTAIFSLVVNAFLYRVQNRLKRNNVWWDDVLLGTARKPIKLAVWFMGLFYALRISARETEFTLLEDIVGLREVALVLLVAWSANRFVSAGEKNYISARQRRAQEVDITVVNAIGKLLKISINVGAGLMVLQSLGVSISGLLAFGGMGGIAVGFAAKDLLANFFGAAMIYFDKPFKVGDWIRSPDREIEGDVERIGWRLVTIRTFDKRPLYVPNSVFTTIAVENPSRMYYRRLNMYVGIRYDDLAHMADITRDVKQMLIDHPEIDEQQTTIVNFHEFNSSSCDFMIYCFTRRTKWAEFYEVKQDVMLKMAAIIEGYGAEIAFPTRTIHMAGGQEQIAEASA